MSLERENRPGGNEAASISTELDVPKSTPKIAAQRTPVGSPIPSIEELLVGALMYGSAAEANAVLKFIDAEDFEPPAKTALASIKALSRRAVPPSPELVRDDLHRRGKLTRDTATWLVSAATSGACASAAREYAAAVLAESFRRQAESFGAALISAAPSAGERDLARLAKQAANTLRYTYGRLTDLRGDVDE